MRLTTKGRYAVTAMIDLAIRQSKGRVSLKSISQRQHISLSYLEQLFAKLRKASLVDGTRGPGGGYALARDVNEISIADIVLAVDESLDVTECEGRKNCMAGHRCLSHDLWNALSRKLHGFLAQIYLGDLMRQSGILDSFEPHEERQGERQNALNSRELKVKALAPGNRTANVSY